MRQRPLLMIFLELMDKRPILFLDSGIGGIPYCREFKSRNPHEALVYLADRQNFPYGERSREELLEILRGLITGMANREDPKMVVLACNTATVSAVSSLREYFPHKVFVGTVPAVKPAVLGTRTGRIGVLGTRRTIEDPYIAELASRYGPKVSVIPIAAPELVEFVEYRYALADDTEKRQVAASYLERFRAAGADGVVLGCTHFLFLLKEFREEAAPAITIYDSVDGITHRIESLLDADGGKLRAGSTTVPFYRMYVSGEGSWQHWVDELGFILTEL
jgi:glutamate racemase